MNSQRKPWGWEGQNPQGSRQIHLPIIGIIFFFLFHSLSKETCYKKINPFVKNSMSVDVNLGSFILILYFFNYLIG